MAQIHRVDYILQNYFWVVIRFMNYNFKVLQYHIVVVSCCSLLLMLLYPHCVKFEELFYSVPSWLAAEALTIFMQFLHYKFWNQWFKKHWKIIKFSHEVRRGSIFDASKSQLQKAFSEIKILYFKLVSSLYIINSTLKMAYKYISDMVWLDIKFRCQ